MSVTLTIDPGQAGGIAVNVFGVVDCRAMPATGGDLLQLLRCIRDAAAKSGVVPVAYLEQVGGFVGKPQPGSTMFKFGQHYGFILGLLQALGIPVALVRPQVWQKVFGLGTAANCASKVEWKNKLKAEAQRRFPQLPVTLATADALLILAWSLRTATTAGHGADAQSANLNPATLPVQGGAGASPTGTVMELQGAEAAAFLARIFPKRSPKTISSPHGAGSDQRTEQTKQTEQHHENQNQ